MKTNVLIATQAGARNAPSCLLPAAGLRILLPLLLFACVAPGPCASSVPPNTGAQPPEATPDHLQVLLAAVENFRSAGDSLSARTALENALSLVQVHSEVRSQILLRLASVYMDDADASTAIPILQSVLNNAETLADTKAAAYLLTAKIYADYGDPSSWVKVRDASIQVLTLENISDLRRNAAREALVPALLNLGENAWARMSWKF